MIFLQKLYRPTVTLKFLYSKKLKEKKNYIQECCIYKVITHNRRIESFPDKQKLTEFITTKLVIQEILKGLH